MLDLSSELRRRELTPTVVGPSHHSGPFLPHIESTSSCHRLCKVVFGTLLISHLCHPREAVLGLGQHFCYWVLLAQWVNSEFHP